jgi:hypothetical protein
MTTLIVWQSWCPETGHPFELKTGLRTKSINRRCQEHRAPGRPVPPRAEGATRAAATPARWGEANEHDLALSGWRRRSWQFPAAILTTMTLR